MPRPGKAPAGRKLGQQYFSAAGVLHAQLPARLGNALIYHQAFRLAVHRGRQGNGGALRVHKGLRGGGTAKARKRYPRPARACR